MMMNIKDESTVKVKALKKDRKDMIQYINLQLAALGQPLYLDDEDSKNKLSNNKFLSLTEGLINSFRENARLLADHQSPVDKRIQRFLDEYLKDISIDKTWKLPNDTLILNQPGMAREVSLPPNGNTFHNEYLTSYRVKQGILNNPAKDKRTTEGTFHIVDGGLPVPLDKKEVPRIAFAHMLHAAFNPSDELKTLPFTSNQPNKARLMVSLLMRPVVVPEVKGVVSEKSMEIRFFGPGSLVSNLDFVESIFGNAGDPNLAENDAALDVEHWTGHTGCMILAPHLTNLKKKEIGLPHYDHATDRQRKDGMCWKDENELYNGGNAFKLTCRDEKGVVVTLIADNYFGYSKKEIKTQIGYAANLFGLVEEEHAGGAIAFPRGNMSDGVDGNHFSSKFEHIYAFEDTKRLLGDKIELFPENYGIDKKYPEIVYIPENANLDTFKSIVYWTYKGKSHSLKLSPAKTYVHPSGHKFQLTKHPTQPLWRIVDTMPEGIFCHKPCTVSGGGKSEISKSMQNAIKYGSFYIKNLDEDAKVVDMLINYDYSKRWKVTLPSSGESRPFLSAKRTLGSAVKLLTPSEQYNDAYNAFLRSIPDYIITFALYIKRLYRGIEVPQDWKKDFNVEIVNGRPSNALRYKNSPIMASFVRIGFSEDGNWFLHKLRSDFVPSHKIQMEDDISATITIPANRLTNLNPEYKNLSVKIVKNCEAYLFQRPDEAIHRGYDKEAEHDIVQPNTFLTNYEPLTKADAIELYEDAINFELYTKPVKEFIQALAESDEEDFYFVTPSHTRIVNGKPTANPRFLEKNRNSGETFDNYLAEIGIRLHRKIEPNNPVHYPVNAVLPGRRNNPVDKKAGIRPLSVYSPIHYQELPELFMDFICSLTGKSPSTTGAGSEGALTKGPFNMLVPTSDLNNALLSYILTEYQGFSSAAGYVGHENRFDHDISILIPEIWARLVPADRDPKLLIDTNCLEKLNDFEYEGQKVLASRLGYRITENFAFRCMNRLFDEPLAVFNERMLKPELQNMTDFVDGINNIVEAQKKVALQYFEEGSIEAAIPPLKVLLHIMAYGHFEGKDISDPDLRKLFDRQAVINSAWYKERLVIKQKRDVAFKTQQVEYLKSFINNPVNASLVKRMDLSTRLNMAIDKLKHVQSPDYLAELVGTIGADPLFKGK
jgi:phosphoenolpyruvate carboxykinase (diphosphate)